MNVAKKITVSVISDLTTDQRVIRISNCLQQMGFDVTVIARCFKNSLPLDTYLFKAQRIHCIFKKGMLQYAEFNIKLFFKLLFIKTDYLLANDLDTLLPNYILHKWRRKKIFYDTHEYFTGVPELSQKPLKLRIWKALENYIFPKLPVVYTVNNSVKNTYQKEYGNHLQVVRNVPVTQIITPINIPTAWQHKTIILLQGAGINEGRGGMELLQAMQILPDEYLLLMIGSGNQWEAIAAKRIQLNLQHKVVMLNKLPPAQLKQYTAIAHVGLSLDSFEDLNCLYNLPNKVFDYIHATVPIIATAIPEVKAIIEAYHVGITITNNEPETIATAIQQLFADQQQYQQLKINCSKAATLLCWENEQHQLIKIYEPFL